MKSNAKLGLRAVMMVPACRTIRSMASTAVLVTASPALTQSADQPPVVVVAPVVVRDVAPAETFIGRVTPIQAVQVVPRITAFIDDVPVKQGSDVNAGQVVYELQKSEYEAALQSAQAHLSSANAALQLAQLAYQRAAKLNQREFAAQATLDQARATRDQDQANVQAAQANVAQAQLNLSYCTISSPITGRIGAVALTKGNLVTPSTPPLATINQLDPIRVVFSVPDNVVVRSQQQTALSAAKIAAGLDVNLRLTDGSAYDATGRIAFLSNQVDTATGTVAVYADFSNPRALLLPGAFVNVEVRPATPEQRMLVPVEAVEMTHANSFVLVIGKEEKVEQRMVELGRQIGQDFIIQKGVSSGERVIVDGAQKVHPGEVVHAISAPPGQTPTGSSDQSGTGG
jgi:membrane fusion protein, multidrug efflux system